jgi:hypothetical protein
VLGRWSPADAVHLAHEWIEQFDLPCSPYLPLLFFTFSEGRAHNANQAEALFLALYDIITARGKDLSDVISVMNELIRERKSGLNSRKCQDELNLPPFP